MLDQVLGLLLGERHEVAPPDSEDMIDEPLERRPLGDGQLALEDDAVEAGEHGDDQLGKLGDEARQRLHGVVLRIGPRSTRFWQEDAVLADPFWLRIYCVRK